VYVCESRQGVRVYIYVRVCETGCESVYICVREKTRGSGGEEVGVSKNKKRQARRDWCVYLERVYACGILMKM